MRLIGKIALASVSLLSLATPAFAAADNAASTDETTKSDEIVVTGSFIRSIAGTGSQSIAVDAAKVEAVGAANTSDLMASIPQGGNFLSYVGVRGSSNFSLAVNRPTLRNLGNAASSTNSTLLLVDSHRMVGMGILQTSADLDAIPASAIERMDIVTDGGSSTYGSDAVGGVVNIITRKKFDGAKIGGEYGFGDKYHQANINAIIGKNFDGGSAYVAYDYSWHTALYGADRAWSQNLNWPLTSSTGSAVGNDTNCVGVANITIGANTFPYSGGTLGAASTTGGTHCDGQKSATFYPRETKHSVLASLLIDQGGPVSFQVKGYYVTRTSTSDGGNVPYFANLTLQTTNPFYKPAGTTLAAETVRVNLGSVLGTTPQTTKMESYGVTPTMRVDIGKGWQLNALANYGRSNAKFRGQLLNATPLGAAVSAGTFDPFNLGAAGNAATIATAADWFQYGRAINQLLDVRAVVDGSLLHLSGGDVKVAIGGEYVNEKYSGITTRSSNAAGLAALADVGVSRRISSLFGELNVPLIGEGNAGGIHSLSISVSGRYDHYSDFGNTFNPKIGVIFEPVDWIKLRGNWGKAFQAPGLSDIAQIGAQTANALPTSSRPFFDPATSVPTSGHNAWIFTVGGTLPGLQPQKAKTWSLGFDMKPPVGGDTKVELGMTYYNIDFKGIIGFAPINNPTFYALYADKQVTYAKGDAAMLAYFNTLTAGVSSAAAQSALSAMNSSRVAGSAATVADFANVYSILDGRTTNLGSVLTSGIDFYFRVNHPTGFGDVYFDISGTDLLTFKNGGTTAVLSTLGIDTIGKFRLSSTVGVDVGNLRAQINWAHNSGVSETPTATNLQQSYVSGMNVFNLYLNYKVGGESLLKDTSLSLNVDNIFDVNPPLYHGLSNSLFGTANGWTLGRVVKLGLSKKF